MDLKWNFFAQFEFWRSDNYKCLFADFEKRPFLKVVLFIFFKIKIMKEIRYDLQFLICCVLADLKLIAIFFQTCTFAEFGIKNIFGWKNWDIQFFYKIRIKKFIGICKKFFCCNNYKSIFWYPLKWQNGEKRPAKKHL